MNLQVTAAVIVNETHFPEPVHEEAHPRSRGADHLGDRLLTDLGDWSLVHAFLAEVGKQQQNPS
jgi:hypothetical protein